MNVCLLFTLPEEAKVFCKSKLNSELTESSHLRVVTTGMGLDTAHGFARATLVQWSPSFLLIAGFCGGLHETLKPGDLVIADSVVEEGNPTTFRPNKSLLTAASCIKFSDVKIHTGGLVSVNQVLTTVQEKERVAQQGSAIAVDMETSAIVKLAEENNVPWLAVRGVTDGLHDVMPLDFNKMQNTIGGVNQSKVTRAVLLRPWKIPGLIRLGRNSNIAATNLNLYLQKLLTTHSDFFHALSNNAPE